MLRRPHAWLTCPRSQQAQPPAAWHARQGPHQPSEAPGQRPTCTGSRHWSPVRSTPVQCPPLGQAGWNQQCDCACGRPRPPASSPDASPSFSDPATCCLPSPPPPRAHCPPSWAPARAGPGSGGATAAAAGLLRSQLSPPASLRLPPRRLPLPRMLRALQSPPTQRPRAPSRGGNKALVFRGRPFIFHCRRGRKPGPASLLLLATKTVPSWFPRVHWRGPSQAPNPLFCMRPSAE